MHGKRTRATGRATDASPRKPGSALDAAALVDDVFMTVDLAARRELYFASGSDRCHAWLYLPEAADGGPPPVIVMALVTGD